MMTTTTTWYKMQQCNGLTGAVQGAPDLVDSSLLRWERVSGLVRTSRKGDTHLSSQGIRVIKVVVFAKSLGDWTMVLVTLVFLWLPKSPIPKSWLICLYLKPDSNFLFTGPVPPWILLTDPADVSDHSLIFFFFEMPFLVEHMHAHTHVHNYNQVNLLSSNISHDVACKLGKAVYKEIL